MSDHRRSGSRSHSRRSRSRGYGQGYDGVHEEPGRGERDWFEGRRGLGGRGGEMMGWGRNGAVRLDDPPRPRWGWDGFDQEMDFPRFMGGRRGSSRPVRSRRAEEMDSYGGLGAMDTSGGLGMGRMGMSGMRMGGIMALGGAMEMGGPMPMTMGGRNPPGNPMMGRNPFDAPQIFDSHSFNRQPSPNDTMLPPRQQVMRPRCGMEQLRSPLMGGRQNFMEGNPGLRSPPPASLASGGSFDMRAMDRPRMPYGPIHYSPIMQNRFANYQSPYVEEYEGSEMDASMAQQAAMQQQQMMMMNGGGGNPFLDEMQYGNAYEAEWEQVRQDLGQEVATVGSSTGSISSSKPFVEIT
ncbi:uncharacterized protein L3040_004878 [Drepanopeziza brunnea f. sp. 'multigermtubi']|uniref:uncharacterized protein n=1 Tax=Drepanopeziza brunnea f. sp. 'multigermtubi' TaxID=698441 RepID=UPI0023977932|nr:hypothetical protein L3040_004878 [Drepanopeziza brunnea f. sp. 'multigermtubi']